MISGKWIVAVAVFAIAPLTVRNQTPGEEAGRILSEALHYADLYNWTDAAPLFADAEQRYAAMGDTRNTLYAHCGVIRSTMEQRSLPETSQELGLVLENNPLLQSDQKLRFFCLTVRGDIDGEIDAAPMRRDWQEALSIAQTLGDQKWENRASAEIGFSLFLEGEMGEARERVSSALIRAVSLGDTGAQIRYLANIGQAFTQLGAYDEALGYLDKALAVAAANPDSGYQFIIQQGRLEAMRGKGELDSAQNLADEIVAEADSTHRYVKETVALITASSIRVARHDEPKAIEDLQRASDLAEKGGFTRLLSDAQFDLADIFRNDGDLARAEELASAAADSTLSSGDLYLIPARLQALAELQVSEGEYRMADATYDRASDLLDTMIGNVTAETSKMDLVTSMSAIYAEHFALLAGHLSDTTKAYSVLEHARGRVTTELMMRGRPPNSEQEMKIEQRIGELDVALTRAKSSKELHEIRNQIFLAEEGRWVVSAGAPQNPHPWQTVPIERIRALLTPNSILLEYVLDEPHSYCLVISNRGAHIVRLAARPQVETLVNSYIGILKAKGDSKSQGERLYRLLLSDIPEAVHAERLVIVPDGQLHLLPFDALVDPNGRYLAYSHTITYASSATALYLAANFSTRKNARKSLLAVGGIPYDQARDLNKLASLSGYTNTPLVSLPASRDEVLAANAAIANQHNTLLIGKNGTKSAFENAGLNRYAVIHLAVHGFANERHPDRAALLLLDDSSKGDDGILDAGQIARLRIGADLVVLSACDTAVGRLQGEEGISNLSLAFMLAGSRTVVSTLWTIDDTSALYLMKRFYAHLSQGETLASALSTAKRDMLKTYGSQTPPYYWASFKLDGVGDRALSAVTTNLTARN